MDQLKCTTCQQEIYSVEPFANSDALAVFQCTECYLSSNNASNSTPATEIIDISDENNDLDFETIDLSSDEGTEANIPFENENNVEVPENNASENFTKAIEYKEKFLQINIPRLKASSLKTTSWTCDLTRPCCDTCGRYYPSEELLNNHIESVHKTRQFISCKFCGIKFVNPWFHQNHAEIYHNVIIVKHSCPLCSKKFETKSELEEHKRTSHKCPFKCNYCEDVTYKTISEIKNLREHLKEHHQNTDEAKAAEFNTAYLEERPLNRNVARPCTECRKLIVPGLSSFVHVLYDHYKMKSCQQCKETFCSSEAMKNHIMESNHVLKYCDLCQRDLRDLKGLAGHMDTFHNSNCNYPFKCECCLKAFRYYIYLRYHYQRHVKTSGDRQYSCQECDRKFFLRTSLRKHVVVVHTQKFPFKCKLCEKGFNYKSDYNRHNKFVHKLVSESPSDIHRCPLCDYKCDTLSGISLHHKTHLETKKKEEPKKDTSENEYFERVKPESGGRMFKCTLCGQTYYRKEFITNHLYLEHAIQLPNFKLKDVTQFKCDHCGKIFLLALHLRKHVSVHLKENSSRCIQCNLCEKDIYGIDSLRNHFQIIHPGSMEAERSITNAHKYEEDAKTDEEQPNSVQIDIFCIYCTIIFCTIFEKDDHDLKVHRAFPMCKVCQKMSGDETSYKIHETIHSQFPCLPCNEVFSSKQDFYCHLEYAHLRYPYACEFCGILASRHDALIKHYKIKHDFKKTPK